jgi:hypothetical protein
VLLAGTTWGRISVLANVGYGNALRGNERFGLTRLAVTASASERVHPGLNSTLKPVVCAMCAWRCAV